MVGWLVACVRDNHGGSKRLVGTSGRWVVGCLLGWWVDGLGWSWVDGLGAQCVHLKGPKCARRRFLSNSFRPVEVFSGFRLGLQCVHLKGPKCARGRKCRIIFSTCRSICLLTCRSLCLANSPGRAVSDTFSKGVIVEYFFSMSNDFFRHQTVHLEASKCAPNRLLSNRFSTCRSIFFLFRCGFHGVHVKNAVFQVVYVKSGRFQIRCVG